MARRRPSLLRPPGLATFAAIFVATFVAAATSACATNPGLMTREERLALTRAGAAEMVSLRSLRAEADAWARSQPVETDVHFTPPAFTPTRTSTPTTPSRSSGPSAPSHLSLGPSPRFTAPASSPSVWSSRSAGSSGDVESLNQAERAIADRYFALRSVRDANTALAVALTQWDQSRTVVNEERVAMRHARYLEEFKMSGRVAALAALCLVGCNSISGQIRSLNSEERDLMNEISVMQDHRKAIIALVAGLQQVQRDGGAARSETALAKLREEYERTKDKMD